MAVRVARRNAAEPRRGGRPLILRTARPSPRRPRRRLRRRDLRRPGAVDAQRLHRASLERRRGAPHLGRAGGIVPVARDPRRIGVVQWAEAHGHAGHARGDRGRGGALPHAPRDQQRRRRKPDAGDALRRYRPGTPRGRRVRPDGDLHARGGTERAAALRAGVLAALLVLRRRSRNEPGRQPRRASVQDPAAFRTPGPGARVPVPDGGARSRRRCPLVCDRTAHRPGRRHRHPRGGQREPGPVLGSRCGVSPRRRGPDRAGAGEHAGLRGDRRSHGASRARERLSPGRDPPGAQLRRDGRLEPDAARSAAPSRPGGADGLHGPRAGRDGDGQGVDRAGNPRPERPPRPAAREGELQRDLCRASCSVT